MRRFIIGFVVGALIAGSITIYASDDIAAQLQNIQASLRSIIQRLDGLETRVGRLEQSNAPSAASTSPAGLPTFATTEFPHESDYFTVLYQPGFESDAAKIAQFHDIAVERLLAEFDTFDIDEMLRTIDVKVHVEPRKGAFASEGSAGTRSGTRVGGVTSTFFAEIYYLAPSAHQRHCCTSLGEPFDDHYGLKVAIHEYAGIVMNIIGRMKSRGWRFQQAPNWYMQGYEEYLAVTLGSEHTRTVTLEAYKARLRQDPGSIRLANGRFHVGNAYSDGVMIMLFLHEVFGKEKVHEFIRSPLAFEDAFTAAFNSDGRLEEKWSEWLAQL